MHAPGPTSWWQYLRVLVAAGDDAVRRLIATTLRCEQMQVVEAASAAALRHQLTTVAGCDLAIVDPAVRGTLRPSFWMRFAPPVILLSPEGAVRADGVVAVLPEPFH